MSYTILPIIKSGVEIIINACRVSVQTTLLSPPFQKETTFNNFIVMFTQRICRSIIKLPWQKHILIMLKESRGVHEATSSYFLPVTTASAQNQKNRTSLRTSPVNRRNSRISQDFESDPNQFIYHHLS